MNTRSAQPMTGAVQDAGNSATLSSYAEVRAGRCQRMKICRAFHDMCYDNEGKDVVTQEYHAERSRFYLS